MKTTCCQVTDLERDRKNIEEAGRVLRAGGLVAFPTETVYGLGANALDEKAAARIYAAKGRPSDNPLIVHIAGREQLSSLVTEITETADRLMDAFWPGPMTLIFPKKPAVPYGTTGGLDTVAVRMPSHPSALALIAAAGVPVAAPSANTSGRPSPTQAEHVMEDMDGKIEMVLDGGPVGIGIESTIVDLTGPVPMILRPGYITREMLEQTVGPVEVDPAVAGEAAPGVRPKAPGMKYRHYAPKVPMILVRGGPEGVVRTIRRLAGEEDAAGGCAGILCTDETKDQFPQGICRSVGSRREPQSVAHNLYAVLREFDGLGVTKIYSEVFDETPLGRSVMNRLSKAAGHQEITADREESCGILTE